MRWSAVSLSLRHKLLAVAVIALTMAGVGVTRTDSASAATSVETNAVNWAIGQIGSTSYYGLCLTLVQQAYQDGANFNIEPLTNYGTFDSNTYPQQVWDDGFNSGTTGGSNTTPPYGALVFFNDPSNYTYSHVMISLGGGNNVSAPDAYDESAVHYETLTEAANSGAYATYVGWWLPDGTGGGSPPPNGTFVSYEGNVYVMAGGAPLYVSNWSYFGGPQPTEALSDAQWASLSTYPANGTVLNPVAGTPGGIYVVAGGAPIYTSTCTPFCSEDPVSVDGNAIVNAGQPGVWSHLLEYPANGTVLNPVAGTPGGIYVVAGGAPIYTSTCTPFCSEDPVSVDGNAIVNAGQPGVWSHLLEYPADGTVLVPVAGTPGGIYVVAGGAPIYTSTCTPFCSEDPVSVDGNAIVNAGQPGVWSHLLEYPADGTVLVPVAGTPGGIYVVAGGAPIYTSTCTPFCSEPTVSVDGNAIVNAGQPGVWSHLSEVPRDGTFIRGFQTGRIYRIAGGSPIYVTDCNALGFVGCNMSFVDVDQWAIDNSGNPTTHMTATPADDTVVEGLPSATYWTFFSGGVLSTSQSSSAVQVNDASLSSFPLDAAPTISSNKAASFMVGVPGTFTVKALAVPTATISETGILPSGVALVNGWNPVRYPSSWICRHLPHHDHGQ